MTESIKVDNDAERKLRQEDVEAFGYFERDMEYWRHPKYHDPDKLPLIKKKSIQEPYYKECSIETKSKQQ